MQYRKVFFFGKFQKHTQQTTHKHNSVIIGLWPLAQAVSPIRVAIWNGGEGNGVGLEVRAGAGGPSGWNMWQRRLPLLFSAWISLPASSSASFQCCCSVTKLCLILWPHGLQHARLPYPSLSPGVCSDSCPLSRWCHQLNHLILFTLFFFCLQSFPASGSSPVSLLFISGGQSIGALASASVFPMNIQGPLISFRIDWFDLAVWGTLKSLLQHHCSKALILWRSAFLS